MFVSTSKTVSFVFLCFLKKFVPKLCPPFKFDLIRRLNNLKWNISFPVQWKLFYWSKIWLERVYIFLERELALLNLPVLSSWRKCMTWNQIDWKVWCSSGSTCLAGSFSCVAFHFLRCKETKSRIRVLTAEPDHLITAFPPPAAHLSLCQSLRLSRRDGRARCVTSTHLAHQIALLAPTFLWRGFVAAEGLAHVHFCSTLYHGSSFWQCVRADVTSTPFLNQNPWHLCTVYVSAAEILCAALLVCFLPPANCIQIWVTATRQ